MRFKYSARTKTGELQAGYVDTISQETALDILLRHELYVTSLAAARETFLEGLASLFRRISKKDLAIFTRQFGTMLEAGISLGDALKTLERQSSRIIQREVILEISLDIDAGLSLSQALERHSKVFSEFYVSLIRSAEVTGRIEEALLFLADYLDREIALNSKIKGALTYPILVIALFLVIGFILVAFVFPQLKPLFAEANAAIPFITKALLTIGDFVLHWWVLILAFIGVFSFIIADYMKSREGRIVLDSIIVGKIPILSPLFKKIYITRFAESASILLKGGIPIGTAIEIASRTMGSAIYREALHDAADGVRRGELLSQNFSRRSEYFFPLVAEMVAVGEVTGKLSDMLSRVAGFYKREIETTTANLVELIQPIIIVVIGILVGLLFASVLFPIYNLVQRGF